MTNERMLELLLLYQVLEQYTTTHDHNGKYDVVAMCTRAGELTKELLNPYVIDKAEKSE